MMNCTLDLTEDNNDNLDTDLSKSKTGSETQTGSRQLQPKVGHANEDPSSKNKKFNFKERMRRFTSPGSYSNSNEKEISDKEINNNLKSNSVKPTVSLKAKVASVLRRRSTSATLNSETKNKVNVYNVNENGKKNSNVSKPIERKSTFLEDLDVNGVKQKLLQDVTQIHLPRGKVDNC